MALSKICKVLVVAPVPLASAYDMQIGPNEQPCSGGHAFGKSCSQKNWGKLPTHVREPVSMLFGEGFKNCYNKGQAAWCNLKNQGMTNENVVALGVAALSLYKGFKGAGKSLQMGKRMMGKPIVRFAQGKVIPKAQQAIAANNVPAMQKLYQSSHSMSLLAKSSNNGYVDYLQKKFDGLEGGKINPKYEDQVNLLKKWQAEKFARNFMDMRNNHDKFKLIDKFNTWDVNNLDPEQETLLKENVSSLEKMLDPDFQRKHSLNCLDLISRTEDIKNAEQYQEEPLITGQPKLSIQDFVTDYDDARIKERSEFMKFSKYGENNDCKKSDLKRWCSTFYKHLNKKEKN